MITEFQIRMITVPAAILSFDNPGLLPGATESGLTSLNGSLLCMKETFRLESNKPDCKRHHKIWVAASFSVFLE
jgi:hypothetical protein